MFTKAFPLGVAVLLLAICVLGLSSLPGVSHPLAEGPAPVVISPTPGSPAESSPPDHKVYPKPPLPRLPRAGGKFNDPTFGTEILRATDERDDSLGVSTFYPHWPTFNRDNTLILARTSSGTALIKRFDAKAFTVGASLEPGPVNVPGKGGVSVNFESAIWHPTDPNLIYCNTGYRDGGMNLYVYNVATQAYSLVKNFTALGGPDDYLWRMTMSADGDIFAWDQMRVGLADANPAYFVVWRKSTDQILYHLPTKGILDKIGLDKTGKYASIAYKTTQPDKTYAAYLTLATGGIDTIKWTSDDSPTGHGDMGSGVHVGFDNWACGINVRWLNDAHAPQTVFRIADENGVADWTMDLHATLLANNEDWLTVGTYREPTSTLPSNGVYRDEIFQVALDGSGRVRRICHTRSSIDNKSDTTGYWAMPKPTISKDGRFIAFTSNWEKSGRYDLFIARVDPAPRLSIQRSDRTAIPETNTRQRRVTQPPTRKQN